MELGHGCTIHQSVQRQLFPPALDWAGVSGEPRTASLPQVPVGVGAEVVVVVNGLLHFALLHPPSFQSRATLVIGERRQVDGHLLQHNQELFKDASVTVTAQDMFDTVQKWMKGKCGYCSRVLDRSFASSF